MASLYTRRDSPYYWLKFTGRDGKTRGISTKCKTESSSDERRAMVMLAEKELEEAKLGVKLRRNEGWAWVEGFLRSRYNSNALSLERYLCAWTSLKLFLQERDIFGPASFTRSHCFEYVGWRAEPNKSKGKYRAGTNTSLLELKTMRIIMQEAVVREMAQGNPCVKLGIRRAARKVKPELSNEDCEEIRRGMAGVEDEGVREMLQNSFEIARHQGCRLSETRLNPFTDVDLERGTITFRAKGGKEFTTALHPAIRPLFERLRAQKKQSTWSRPEGTGRQWASSKWWKFLDGIGLKARGVTFHSTRVTVITEMARHDVHQSKAKQFVGHGSTAVHEIYQRIRPGDDLSSCLDAVAKGKRPTP